MALPWARDSPQGVKRSREGDEDAAPAGRGPPQLSWGAEGDQEFLGASANAKMRKSPEISRGRVPADFKSADAPDVARSLLAQYGLREGSRVEIAWDVEEEDDDDEDEDEPPSSTEKKRDPPASTEKKPAASAEAPSPAPAAPQDPPARPRRLVWWGATVGRPLPPLSATSPATFDIVYDAKEGFESESARVSFPNSRWLLDEGAELEDGEGVPRMRWRVEGTGGPNDGAGETDDDAPAPGGPTLTSAQMVRWMDCLAGAPGGQAPGVGAATNEAHLAAAVAHLPIEMQQRLASGYREFLDFLRTGVAALHAQNPGAAISAADVSALSAQFLKRQRPE